MEQEYKKRKRLLPIIAPEEKPNLDEIEKFEKDKNIVFPHDFKEFLKENNGCRIGDHIYDFSNIDSLLHFELEHHGIDTNIFQLYSEKKDEYKEFEMDFPELFESLLNFADAESGHAQICISISGNNKGNIYYVYDEDIDMTFKISDSFTEFMNSSLSPYDNEFEEACDKGDEVLAISLINNGFDLNTKNEYNSSLLDLAINSEHEMLDLVISLINKGLKAHDLINSSIKKGHSKILKFLISKNTKIEVDRLDKLLIFAIDKGYTEIFKLLFEIYNSEVKDDLKFFTEKSLIILIEKHISQSTPGSEQELKYKEILELLRITSQ